MVSVMIKSNFDENIIQGWIKLYRSTKNHWLYPSDREFTEFEAWIDLILEVNHKPKKVRIKGGLVACDRGQSVRSMKEWGNRWQWGKDKVRRFFDLLKSDDMIVTENLKTTTRLTICNYEVYQDKKHVDESQNDTDAIQDSPLFAPPSNLVQDVDEIQSGTNNNDKNDQELNNGSAPALTEVAIIGADIGLGSPILTRKADDVPVINPDYYPNQSTFIEECLINRYSKEFAEHLWNHVNSYQWAPNGTLIHHTGWKFYIAKQKSWFSDFKNKKNTNTQNNASTIKHTSVGDFSEQLDRLDQVPTIQ
jgi:hypothetical protein